MATATSPNMVSPNFIEARNKKLLVEEMRGLILRTKINYVFFSIQELSGGSFIAWYNEEFKFTYTKHLKERSE